jgi:hypothetical protein
VENNTGLEHLDQRLDPPQACRSRKDGKSGLQYPKRAFDIFSHSFLKRRKALFVWRSGRGYAFDEKRPIGVYPVLLVGQRMSSKRMKTPIKLTARKYG